MRENNLFSLGSPARTTQRAHGTVSSTFVSPPGTVEVTDSTSKGFEIDAIFNPTKNWRILFNVACEEAVRGETSAAFGAGRRATRPTAQAIVWDSIMDGWTGQSYSEINILNPLAAACLKVARRSPRCASGTRFS